MQCPSCGADITDQQARFCSRCGAAIDGAEGEATGRLDEPTSESTTRVSAPPDPSQTVEAREPAAPSEPSRGTPAGIPFKEFAEALRHSFSSGGWPAVAGAAALAFLFLLGLGAVLLIAFKLDFPEAGTGGNPLGVLTALVLIALGSLGAPLRFDELVVGFLPLGSLIAAGLIIMWVAGQFVAQRDAVGLRARAMEGAKVGVPLALYCLLAALIFRLRATVDVSADPAMALFLGAWWGALFGALGGIAGGYSVGRVTGELMGGVRRRRNALYEGLAAGGVMLAVTGLLSLAALLLWIIVGLVRGEPTGGLTVGDAVAAFVYLLFTLPNLLALIAAIALGAPVEVGARVVFSGRLVGPLEEFSLYGWGGETIGTAALLLLLIPVLACLLGGFSARRASADPGRVWEVVGVAAATYALALVVLVWLGGVRLGAGIVGRGFGRLAADPFLTLVWALLWAALAGFAGWKLAEVQEPKPDAPGAAD